jgi:glycosyltransferase involved in cell wall biosynthesis
MLGVSFTFACHAADVHLAGAPGPLEHAAVHRADSVIACTEHLRRHLVEKRGYPAGKVHVVRHGVDLAVLDAIPQSEKEPGARPVIGAVARFVPKKGLSVLLEAAAPLLADLDAELHIVGDGPLRPQLEREASQRGIVDRTRFLGSRPWRETLALMAGFSVLAAPSVKAADGDLDGLPNVLLEAGALGVPIVASHAGGIPELVSDGKTGWLVTPGKAGPLSKALRCALTQTEEAARRSSRLREAIRSDWKAQVLVQGVADAFAEARSDWCVRQGRPERSGVAKEECES